MSASPNSFHIPDPRPAAARRFFAFHHAGGASASLAKFKTYLPPDTELVLAELPGRGRLTSMPPFTDWSGLVRHLSASLSPLHDRPSYFFGHSLGGLVAYELLAARTDYPPTLLAVSAINAPGHLVPSQFTSETPPTDAELIARIRETGGAPKEILEVPGLIERYLPILRTDLELMRVYAKPATPRTIPGPITVYQPSEDPWITSAGIARWADFTRGEFRVQFREGGHFYLFDQLPALVANVLAQEPK